MNNCPLDLWVHATTPAALVELPPKQAGAAPAEQVYDWPGMLFANSGAIKVTEGSATGFYINELEVNASKVALNVNLTNVDWVGLPVEVRETTPPPA